MISFFKTKFQERFLKQASKVKRNLKGSNFETAKSIGIIATHNFGIGNDGLRYLSDKIQKGTKVDMLFYYPIKELPDNVISTPSRIVFSNKECTWIERPKSTEITSFINNNYDLLIDMSSEEHFPLKYILSMSKASFKVSRIKYENAPYDFILEGDINSNEDYIKNLEIFLPKIK